MNERADRQFPAGTIARCNWCDFKAALPREVSAIRAGSAWRITDMVMLPCGHMDCHWVFPSDNPEAT